MPIRVETHKVGIRPPTISIGVPATHELVPLVGDYLRYIIEIDLPGIEVLVAHVEDEPWHECRVKNALAQAATTDNVILTALDDHPSASIIERTRRELEANEYAVVVAMRLDGLPNGRAFPNPWALGDWLCMRRDRYIELGGYDEALRPAAWTENEFLGRAVRAGYDVVMLDERVFHAWHPERVDREQMREDSECNRRSILEAGGALAVLYYPTLGCLETSDWTVSISVRPQMESAVNVTQHLPYNDAYWPSIFHDKALRIGDIPDEST